MKSGNYHLTLEERKEIERLSKEGKSLQEISVAICRGKTTIRQERKRCERGRYSAEEAHKQFTSSWKERSVKLSKKFSAEEEQKIKLLILEGRSRSQIRTAVGCSFYKIEEWFVENNPNYRGSQVLSIEQRLQSIEQHIEILFDLVTAKDQKN